MRLVLPIVLALLAGCASPSRSDFRWQKQGATADDFETDLGQCQAQAFSVPGVSLRQAVIVQTTCLRGKGWRQVQS
jgi:hypothetical protein